MTPSDEPLARHISAELDEARLERQVAAITAASGRRSVARRRLAVVASAGIAVASLLALRSSWSPPSRAALSASGTTVEAEAEPETITLADGSRAVLDPQSKLTLLTMRADLVRVALERGAVDMDVVHAEGKELIVLARGYEVRVLGTRFSVRLGQADDAPAVVVKVVRGRVRVTRTGDDTDLRVLDAGEMWSAAPLVPTPTPAAVEPSKAEPARLRAASEAAEAGESTRELLARAEAFRSANDPRAAARVLDALRSRHRGDPRAGLAAFELGRIRLDRLGDPRGAAEAFEDALALGPAAPFREDAQARLVEAFAASGDRARCKGVRAAYLSRYPRGLHQPKVVSLCPE